MKAPRVKREGWLRRRERPQDRWARKEKTLPTTETTAAHQSELTVKNAAYRGRKEEEGTVWVRTRDLCVALTTEASLPGKRKAYRDRRGSKKGPCLAFRGGPT